MGRSQSRPTDRRSRMLHSHFQAQNPRPLPPRPGRNDSRSNSIRPTAHSRPMQGSTHKAHPQGQAKKKSPPLRNRLITSWPSSGKRSVWPQSCTSTIRRRCRC
eukprot:Rmarinus@m.23638